MVSLTIRLRSSAVFRLLLVVSLWDGPVLWGHVHAVGAGDLMTHLQQFHLHDPEPFGLGWHWHLSLPEDGKPGSPGDSGKNRAHPPRLLTKPLQCGVDSLSASSGASEPATVLRLETLAPSRCRAFSRLPSINNSPQLLLCRLSC